MIRIVLSDQIRHIGKTHYSLIKAILGIAPANIHLSELQVWEAVVCRELAEDMGEVDAGGRPGGIKGHNPNHLGGNVSTKES